jgi:hypothetical protein
MDDCRTILTEADARGIVASYIDNAEGNAEAVYRALVKAEHGTHLDGTASLCTTETYAMLRAALADLTGVDRYRLTIG